MPEEANRRKYPRYDVPRGGDGKPPVLLRMPWLADEPLVPEDISAGGFQITLTERPSLPQPPIPCAVEIGGADAGSFEADMVWVQENPTDPPTWSVGCSVEMSERNREFFGSVLEKTL